MSCYEWQEAAACLTHKPHIFFTPGLERHAKAICDTCPVRIQCLEFAVNSSEGGGVFGGTNPTERQRTHQRRTCRTASKAPSARHARRRCHTPPPGRTALRPLRSYQTDTRTGPAASKGSRNMRTLLYVGIGLGIGIGIPAGLAVGIVVISYVKWTKALDEDLADLETIEIPEPDMDRILRLVQDHYDWERDGRFDTTVLNEHRTPEMPNRLPLDLRNGHRPTGDDAA